MPIEAESPEQFGYERIRFNLAESSVSDVLMGELAVDLDGLILRYGDHLGTPELRAAIAAEAPGLEPGDVIVTPGAAAALFIVGRRSFSPVTTSSSPGPTTRATSRRRGRSAPTSATWSSPTRRAGGSTRLGSPP